jgi:hypothetical protein
MLVFDEASRVPDEVYQALHPTIAVGGGDLWLMSTPCGPECPRIEAEYVEEERREKTADCFAQEYLCEDDSVTELDLFGRG